MSITALHHVQLAMPIGGEDAAREFFAGPLGLTEVPKPADMAARGGCWFEKGEVRLHLGVEADFRPARKAHPALLVEDLPSLVDRLRTNGTTLAEGDPLEGFAHRWFVDDPFGNRIELLQPAT
ncbi:MAG: glyoxalase [Acidimicrobiales bacterium]|nr:glyoxalase [Acidimicrobiales bacterium]